MGFYGICWDLTGVYGGFMGFNRGLWWFSGISMGVYGGSMGFDGIYSPVSCYITIEHDHL